MLRFKLLHLDGLEEEEPSKYLTFGTTMHAILDLAHAGAEPPSRSDLFDWLDRYWIPHSTQAYALAMGIPVWKALGYESAEEELAYMELGRRLLDDYYLAQIQSNYRQAWKRETLHQLPLPGTNYRLSVKIDRIDKLENGRYRIIDYKTSQRKKNPDELDEDLQILLYSWATHEIYDIDYDLMEPGLYFLRHQQWVPAKTQVDMFMVGAALERVNAVIRDAEAGRFTPTTGWHCNYCQARSVCPVFKEASS